MPFSGSPVCTVTTASNVIITLPCTVLTYTQTDEQKINNPGAAIQYVVINSVCATSSNCDTLTDSFKVTIKDLRNCLISGSKQTLTDSNYLGLKMNNLDNSKTLQFQRSSTNTWTDLEPRPFESYVLTSIDNQVTGKIAKYVFTMKSNQELPTTSNFYLVLPDEIDMQGDQVGCTTTLDGQAVSCETDKTNKRFKIVLTKLFTDNTINSNTFRTTSTTLLITIQFILNPYSLKPSNPILI